MIKKNWIYILFVFAIILFIVTRFKKSTNGHQGEVLLSLKTFQTPLGWGYDILTNDSVFIHQEFIPSIEGRKGFLSEAEASIVGNLSIERIKHRQLPNIKLTDLDSLHIHK